MEYPSFTSHWILLHGLGREARHWDDFPKQLAHALGKHGDRARVDVIDLPGSGKYSYMKAPLSIVDTTKFVREKFVEIRKQMSEQGMTPPEHTRLVAISMGGMVAANWVNCWPDDFKELVLINTSFSGYSKFYNRLRPSAIAPLVSGLLTRSSFDREYSFLSLISNNREAMTNSAIARRWSTYQDERPFTLQNFLRQALASVQFRAPASPSNTQTLVLYSANDRMVSPTCSLEIAHRWKVPYFEHPWAGHYLTLDDGDWVIKKIIEWESNVKPVNLEIRTKV